MMWHTPYQDSGPVDTIRDEITRVLSNIQNIEAEIHRNPSASPSVRNERRSILESLKRQLADLRGRMTEAQPLLPNYSPVMQSVQYPLTTTSTTGKDLARGHLDTLRGTMRARHAHETRQLREEYDRQVEAIEARHRHEQDTLTHKFEQEERTRATYENARQQLETAKRELEEMVMGGGGGIPSPRALPPPQMSPIAHPIPELSNLHRSMAGRDTYGR